MHYDEVDGVLWARGAAYKASFGPEGAYYIPFLGSHAPRNYPHALSPSSVTRGGAAIAFARESSAQRAGDRIELDRGAFVEAYELSLSSIEQLFVFDALDGDGDLVLTIPAASEMTARETASGLEFENEHGRVSYSRAVAIDATGRRSLAPTSFEDGAIVIRVDDAFLDGATLPLTIDPVLTSVAVDNSALNALEADVAYDEVFDRWLVVYEYVYSDVDHDILSKTISADGTTFLGLTYIDFTASDWRSARCANNRLTASWLVVAQVGGATVKGRTVAAGTLSTGPQFLISDSSGGVTPDVGGDPYPFSFPGSAYCVVYMRIYSDTDYDILARFVGSNGALLGTGPIYLSNSGGTLDFAPTISKSNAEVEWMVTWERYDPPSGNSTIWNARIEWDGTVSQTPALLTTLGPNRLPEVSSTIFNQATFPSRNLIVFQKQMSSTDTDIIMMLVEGSTVLSTANLGQLENFGAFDTSHQVLPSVDCDGDHFVVAYCDQYLTSTTDYDIYCDDVYVNGTTLGLSQVRVNLAFSGTLEYSPHVASARAASSGLGFNPANERRYFIAWDDNRTSTNGQIEGAVFDAVIGGEHRPFCFGDGSASACPCGNSGAFQHGCAHSFSAAGALLAGSGFVSTTQDTFRLDATNLPPNGSQVTFFQGTLANAGTVFGDGIRCAVGAVVRLATVSSTNGNASIGFGVSGSGLVSVSGMIPATGGARFYQVNYRNAAVFCTTASFNVTNGVRAVWVP
jgi:hypothetical protein